MSQDEQQVIVTQRSEGVLTITINRPHVRNAIDTEVASGLLDAADMLDGDPGLRVGILTGAGGTFCAGIDLKAFAAGSSHLNRKRDRDFVQSRSIKPMIAAVEGFAVGGGLELALACDLLVLSKGARLGTPEVTRGLAAAGGALLRLPRRIPYHVAMRMALTGELISASRAFEVGLASELCADGDALGCARRLAERIVQNAPLAVVASKAVLRDQSDWADKEMWVRQAELLDPVFGSEDALEGARSFSEKRKPGWSGR